MNAALLFSQIDGAVLVRSNPKRTILFVWFGGHRVYEYDAGGACLRVHDRWKPDAPLPHVDDVETFIAEQLAAAQVVPC